MDNLRIGKVVHPKDRPPQNEWFKEYNVGGMYVEPTKYFAYNHFDADVYTTGRTANRSILSGISKLLNLLSWAA